MPASIADIAILFAQAPAPAAGGAAGGGQIQMVLIFGMIALWFYLLILRPQQKQDKQRKLLLAGLKKNDRVLTSAGIYGIVTSVDPDQDKVSVRIDDDRGVKVVFTRASIVRILDGSEEKSKDKDRTSKEKATEIA
jgi:preprotein translocase subunit YajC